MISEGINITFGLELCWGPQIRIAMTCHDVSICSDCYAYLPKCLWSNSSVCLLIHVVVVGCCWWLRTISVSFCFWLFLHGCFFIKAWLNIHHTQILLFLFVCPFRGGLGRVLWWFESIDAVIVFVGTVDMDGVFALLSPPSSDPSLLKFQMGMCFWKSNDIWKVMSWTTGTKEPTLLLVDNLCPPRDNSIWCKKKRYIYI